jgi:XTP/dITP diphosphohydrolase
MIPVIFASRNKGKIKEVIEILNDANIKLYSLLGMDDTFKIIESGTTFEENAKIKALEVYNAFRIPAIGDDSGLSVEQLNGKPGVYSARYAGENATDDENNEKLLMELQNFPEPHFAKFICSAVYYDGKNFLSAYGELRGRIINSPHGENGFGYDPLFIPEGYSKTTAEIGLKEKNKISHRSIAFNMLKDLIINLMEKP